jgi:hypothetical protein
MLDGVSFPVIVRGFDEETGEGGLVGYAVIQSVDMLYREVEHVKLPDDFVLREKKIFKFR